MNNADIKMSDIKMSEVSVMNSRAGAIMSAHTGVLCCEFSSFHKYIEEIIGGPIFTHQLADRALTDEIKDKSKDDFIKLIKSQYAEPVKYDQIKFLWSLLDDISTAGDMFKPEINGYFKYINSICEKRSEVANSLDGYSLTINNHSPLESRIKELEFSLDDRDCYIADADMKNEELAKRVAELDGYSSLMKRDNLSLHKKVAELEAALCEISNMCVGEIAMNYRLDAQCIGEIIYKATGLTNPELNKALKESE